MDLTKFPEYDFTKQGDHSGYMYTEDEDARIYTMYHGRRPLGTTECFQIVFSTDSLAELYSMRTCGFQDTASSHKLLHAALALAKEKGATRIELTDQANKRLPYNRSFRLSSMYFLTTGRTWYETYGGFQPILKDSKYISMWRQTVLTNCWNRILQDIPDMQIPVEISDVDGSAEGSAMEVFRRIRETHPSFFADYPRELLVGALETITWYADL